MGLVQAAVARSHRIRADTAHYNPVALPRPGWL